MSAQILDGKSIANKIKDELKQEVERLRLVYQKVPRMVNVLISGDHGSHAYMNSQKKAAEYIGIGYEVLNLPEDINQEQFCHAICALDADPLVNGIIIHKPIPKHLEFGKAANLIDLRKDIEGVNAANIGLLVLGHTKIIPCTPAAVMKLLESSGVSLKGKETVIVGHSQIVGKPLSLLLLKELATVTVCHIGTSEAGKLEEHVKRAEILIVAVGKAELVKGEWIKPGAIVIDVGINQVNDVLVGDVEFSKASEKASFITPVPGGVGPVTVVMLLKNVVEAFKKQIED